MKRLFLLFSLFFASNCWAVFQPKQGQQYATAQQVAASANDQVSGPILAKALYDKGRPVFGDDFGKNKHGNDIGTWDIDTKNQVWIALNPDNPTAMQDLIWKITDQNSKAAIKMWYNAAKVQMDAGSVNNNPAPASTSAPLAPCEEIILTLDDLLAPAVAPPGRMLPKVYLTYQLAYAYAYKNQEVSFNQGPRDAASKFDVIGGVRVIESSLSRKKEYAVVTTQQNRVEVLKFLIGETIRLYEATTAECESMTQSSGVIYFSAAMLAPLLEGDEKENELALAKALNFNAANEHAMGIGKNDLPLGTINTQGFYVNLSNPQALEDALWKLRAEDIRAKNNPVRQVFESEKAKLQQVAQKKNDNNRSDQGRFPKPIPAPKSPDAPNTPGFAGLNAETAPAADAPVASTNSRNLILVSAAVAGVGLSIAAVVGVYKRFAKRRKQKSRPSARSLARHA